MEANWSLGLNLLSFNEVVRTDRRVASTVQPPSLMHGVSGLRPSREAQDMHLHKTGRTTRMTTHKLDYDKSFAAET